MWCAHLAQVISAQTSYFCLFIILIAQVIPAQTSYFCLFIIFSYNFNSVFLMINRVQSQDIHIYILQTHATVHYYLQNIFSL